jgi:hypothetical protein
MVPISACSIRKKSPKKRIIKFSLISHLKMDKILGRDEANPKHLIYTHFPQILFVGSGEREI